VNAACIDAAEGAAEFTAGPVAGSGMAFVGVGVVEISAMRSALRERFTMGVATAMPTDGYNAMPPKNFPNLRSWAE
jgi:hypothetical protein